MAVTIKYKNCSCCKCTKSDLGIHYFNSDELLCLNCEIKRSRTRR